MTSIENIISRSLRAVLAELPDGADISLSEEFQTFITGLEHFVPQVIGEIHPEMRGQSGDGVLPIVARKTGEGEVELLGHFCFIADQTLTPIHLKLQLADAGDEISWLECHLGQRGKHGMLRTPYESPSANGRLLNSLPKRTPSIDWVYEVTFGERRTRDAAMHEDTP